MSVINKMLRDLDARRSAARAGTTSDPQGGVMRGIASVKGEQGPAGLHRRAGLLLLLLLGVATLAWWYVEVQREPTASGGAGRGASAPVMPQVPQPVAALPAAQAPVALAGSGTAPLGPQQLNQMLDQAAVRSATAPTATASVEAMPAVVSTAGPSPEQAQQQAQQVLRNTPGGQLPLQAKSPGLAFELQQQLAMPPAQTAASPLPTAPATPRSVPARALRTPAAPPMPASAGPAAGRTAAPLAALPAPAAESGRGHESVAPSVPRLSQAGGHQPSALRSDRSATPAPALPAPASTNPRQAAALETLSRARQLWDTGSRDAALDVMRQAVALAERLHAGGADPIALPAFHSLVRELVRMELAQGQAGVALEQLVRLEPLLADQADLWALRGNAAQRLGRHAESVQSYQMALRLRPGEPRWMLASAVSLAAQGQLLAAAEQAELARAAGAVSPEVLVYLRQQGVPLR